MLTLGNKKSSELFVYQSDFFFFDFFLLSVTFVKTASWGFCMLALIKKLNALSHKMLLIAKVNSALCHS